MSEASSWLASSASRRPVRAFGRRRETSRFPSSGSFGARGGLRRANLIEGGQRLGADARDVQQLPLRTIRV